MSIYRVPIKLTDLENSANNDIHEAIGDLTYNQNRLKKLSPGIEVILEKYTLVDVTMYRCDGPDIIVNLRVE